MNSLSPVRLLVVCIAVALSASLEAQGGGGGSSIAASASGHPATTAPQPLVVDPLHRVSIASPFVVGCDQVPPDGTLYQNSEVEPYVAVNPQNTNNVIGVWQQDRWSTGGAHGLMAGASFNGGKTWLRTPLPFSRCGGGTVANGGNYARTSDPWVSIGPTGIAYTVAISFEGANSAVLASRSLDGGKTWSDPATLILDGASFFNDKEAVTADPNDPKYVYTVWDRLPSSGGGPAMIARSVNSGASWQPAHKIYNPGIANQTIGNEIVVLPDGTLVDAFTQFNGNGTAEARIVRSTDKGLIWSTSIKVADLFAVGASDPETGAGIRDGADLPQVAVSPTGVLYMTWADARFSGGVRDGIALSQSTNGGLNWTAPVRINGNPNVEAFEPSVHVRSDGTICVTYFDFRNNTSDPKSLPTTLWLARSTNATTWNESAVTDPFDLLKAPNAGGLFVGDYQGLSSLGSVSEPFFVRTNAGTGNRTDVYSAPALSVAAMLNLMTRALGTTAQPAAPFEMTAAFRKRVSDNLGHVMERREVEWRKSIEKRQSLPPTQRR